MSYYIEQGRRDSNPQPSVLETGTLPIELLPYVYFFCFLCSLGSRQLSTDDFLPNILLLTKR